MKKTTYDIAPLILGGCPVLTSGTSGRKRLGLIGLPFRAFPESLGPSLALAFGNQGFGGRFEYAGRGVLEGCPHARSEEPGQIFYGEIRCGSLGLAKGFLGVVEEGSDGIVRSLGDGSAEGFDKDGAGDGQIPVFHFGDEHAYAIGEV